MTSFSYIFRWFLLTTKVNWKKPSISGMQTLLACFVWFEDARCITDWVLSLRHHTPLFHYWCSGEECDLQSLFSFFLLLSTSASFHFFLSLCVFIFSFFFWFLKRSTSRRLEELQVLDIKFLYGCAKPTIAVLYQVDPCHLFFSNFVGHALYIWQIYILLPFLNIILEGKISTLVALMVVFWCDQSGQQRRQTCQDVRGATERKRFWRGSVVAK